MTRARIYRPTAPVEIKSDNVARRYQISTEQQRQEVVVRRYQQYEDAFADDRAFQRRYMVEVPITDGGFRKLIGVLSCGRRDLSPTSAGKARQAQAGQAGRHRHFCLARPIPLTVMPGSL